MCDRFKNDILEKVIERIKVDTFALEILKDNYGIDVFKCSNSNNENFDKCKKYYVNWHNSFIKGACCRKCKKYLCEICALMQFANNENGGSCIQCMLNDHSVVKCPKCEFPITVHKEVRTHGICLTCQSFVSLF